MTDKHIRFLAFSAAFALHAALLFFKPLSFENDEYPHPEKLRVSLRSYSPPNPTQTNDTESRPKQQPEKKAVTRPKQKRTLKIADTKMPPTIEASPSPSEKTNGEDASKQMASAAPSEQSNIGDYPSLIRKRVERNKFYPRASLRMNHEGTTVIELGIAPDGAITGIVISSSSGYSALDDAAIHTLERSAPLPPPRKYGLGAVRLTIPVDFSLY
ncbi:hypothetical protein CHL67_08865 [Prosthecochloris sp. GSB1]|uniref:energy transducer TonB family protein n=1 Tax=Prosthecochloris sp. GSB1 TaxID=281093 RepID=UPI000B8C824E|nr:energy transducer TonB [Prosthecochloris sp. GSB1]ASQ91015.1 hypothetical protein CHL67_08865 [Prosthecochloris sp. GSB1]